MMYMINHSEYGPFVCPKSRLHELKNMYDQKLYNNTQLNTNHQYCRDYLIVFVLHYSYYFIVGMVVELLFVCYSNGV